MESMVELNIFKVIQVYDLQALCCELTDKKSHGDTLWNVSCRWTFRQILKCNVKLVCFLAIQTSTVLY